jgi:hypothetical protein
MMVIAPGLSVAGRPPADFGYAGGAQANPCSIAEGTKSSAEEYDVVVLGSGAPGEARSDHG